MLINLFYIPMCISLGLFHQKKIIPIKTVDNKVCRLSGFFLERLFTAVSMNFMNFIFQCCQKIYIRKWYLKLKCMTPKQVEMLMLMFFVISPTLTEWRTVLGGNGCHYSPISYLTWSEFILVFVRDILKYCLCTLTDYKEGGWNSWKCLILQPVKWKSQHLS